MSEDGPEALLEGVEQPDLEEILNRWLVIAAVGFEGGMIRGRGAVVVTMDATKTEVEYVAGSPCPCHTKLIDEYDLQNQIVIVLRSFVHLCFWTGLRPSEVLGLQDGDVDHLGGRAQVQRSHYLYELGDPKTRAARRTIERGMTQCCGSWSP